MRFRLLRSRAFWVGVPGLVFLLWGWWTALRYYSSAGCMGATFWEIGQIGGEVYAYWDSGGGPDWRQLTFIHLETIAGAEVTHSVADVRGIYPTVRLVRVPYYWPVFGYVAVWAGLIRWRSEKYRQASKAAEVA